MKRIFSLVLILELSMLSLGILVSVHADTPSDFKVAFIGDQGLKEDSKEVLKLIKDERADMVLHQGGFDYANTPDLWDQQINDILGPDFPYFASIGNHDVAMWPGYQQKLTERLNRIPEAICTGDLGAQSACQYKGLFFILSGIGTMGEGHEIYIRNQLAQDNSVWRICSWHKNQRLMQVGKNGNSTGWGVYEQCRLGGAIIATAHSHTYSRTHLMDNFSSRPRIASTSNTLQLEKGKNFVFVSGLGGDTIETQSRNDAWWASIYAGKRTAEFGALFCTFNVNGQPDHASCYFKDIAGRTIDSFTLISRIHSDNVHTLPLLSTGGPSAATNLQAQVECSKTELRKGLARLRWTVTSPGNEQRVDVTIFPNGFETGQFETVGPLPPDWSSLTLDPLKGQAIHHWRVLTRHGDTWLSSQTESFEGPTCVADIVR